MASGGEEESPGILSDDQPPDSPNESNDSDETSKNFPWMRAVTSIINSFNFYCTHQNFCHPYCYKRHTRAASRLMKSVRKVSLNRMLIKNYDKSLRWRTHDSRLELKSVFCQSSELYMFASLAQWESTGLVLRNEATRGREFNPHTRQFFLIFFHFKLILINLFLLGSIHQSLLFSIF